MKRSLVVLVLVLAHVCLAQEFSIKSQDGKIEGPFILKDGSVLSAGGSIFEVVQVKTGRDMVLERMQRIILPEVDFRQAHVSDVVSFLTEVSRSHDKSAKGINIVLKPGADVSATDAEQRLESITLKARYINLLDALTIVTHLAGLKFRVQGETVLLCRASEPDGEIKTRVYHVLPSVEVKMSSTHSRPLSEMVEQENREWRDSLAGFGVSWPDGSSLRYLRGFGRLVVSNTEENLNKVGKVLEILCVEPSNVSIEVQFVEFDLAAIENLGTSGVNSDVLTAMWTNGLGKLICSCTLFTQAGQETTVKGVTEYIYPTEFSVLQRVGTNTNSVAAASVVEPSGFETREVGSIVTVLPDVSPDGAYINLTFTPELTEEPVWHQYGSSYLDANGQQQFANMVQPFFHNYSVVSSMSFERGKRALAGGGMLSRDRTRTVYLFVTADLVGLDGRALAKGLD